MAMPAYKPHLSLEVPLQAIAATDCSAGAETPVTTSLGKDCAGPGSITGLHASHTLHGAGGAKAPAPLLAGQVALMTKHLWRS